MHQIYSGGEVLFIAMQIEQNGAATYRKLAAKYPQFAGLLSGLATDEDAHYATFAGLHRDAGKAGAWHEEEEAQAYLNRLAGSFVFEENADPLAPFAAVKTLADVFDVAIGQERKSIDLYEAMLKVVRRADEAKLVRQIIAEEHRHVADLTKAKGTA